MTPELLEAFLKQEHIDFPVAVDKPNGTELPLTMDAYGMQGTPTLLLFDRQGRLRRHYLGAVDDVRLGAEIMALAIEDAKAPREASIAIEQRLAEALVDPEDHHHHITTTASAAVATTRTITIMRTTSHEGGCCGGPQPRTWPRPRSRAPGQGRPSHGRQKGREGRLRRSGLRMPLSTAAVIRHVAFEDLGVLAPVLAARGISARYFEAGVDDLGAIERDAPDLLVVLGGPIGVYDEPLYPFLGEEIALIERRLRAGAPTARHLPRRPAHRQGGGRARLSGHAEGDRVFAAHAHARGRSLLPRRAETCRLQRAALARRHVRSAGRRHASRFDADHAEPGVQPGAERAGAAVSRGSRAAAPRALAHRAHGRDRAVRPRRARAPGRDRAARAGRRRGGRASVPRAGSTGSRRA